MTDCEHIWILNESKEEETWSDYYACSLRTGKTIYTWYCSKCRKIEVTREVTPRVKN